MSNRPLCRKKYHTYLKHDGLWGCFSFRYFNIYEVKRRQVYFVIYTCTAIWKKTKKIIYFDISFTGIWNLKRLGIYNKTLVEICREVLRKLTQMLEREYWGFKSLHLHFITLKNNIYSTNLVSHLLIKRFSLKIKGYLR